MSHIGAAAGASSCVPPAGKSTITSCFLDLTGSPSSTRAPQSAVLNGGIFRVPAQNEAVAQGAFDGTGVLQPFVRIQERSNGSTLGLNGIESGYNTEGWDAMGNPVSSGLDNPRTGASGGNHSIRL